LICIALTKQRGFGIPSNSVLSRRCDAPLRHESQKEKSMNFLNKTTIVLAGMVGSSLSVADTLPTHRIPAALAIEAASETISECAKQGYRERPLYSMPTAQLLLRGDGAGIHTLDSAHGKAYTSVSFKNDTISLAERAKGEDSIAPLSKLPHVMSKVGELPTR
jgi:hypothetical protein